MNFTTLNIQKSQEKERYNRKKGNELLSILHMDGKGTENEIQSPYTEKGYMFTVNMWMVKPN